MEDSYQFGDRVEKKIMCGRLAGCWVPAQVIKVNVNRGTVNVGVLNHVGYKVQKFHVDVPLCYVRQSKHKFKVGDHVYTKILRGQKQGLWIPANLIFLNHDGTFDLLVEQYRTYLVTKYSVHVPEKYLIPGDLNSYRENKSPESKNSTCDWCRFCAWKKELSKETKSSLLSIDKSYINNVQLFQGCVGHPSESHSLALRRSKTGEPGFPAMGRQLITRTVSAPREQEQFSFAWTPERGFNRRCCGKVDHLQPPGCHSVVKPPFFNTNPLSDVADNTRSRESYEDLETSQFSDAGENEPFVDFGSQQRQMSDDERSWTRPPAVQKLNTDYTDWEEQYEWSKSRPSDQESTTCVSPSPTMTDWGLSPRKSGSPTDLNNVSNYFCSKRDGGRGPISSRYADRPMSIGGKSTILSAPRNKYDFMASYLSQDKATSFRKDLIFSIRVKGHSIKHKMIEMDIPLEELALWLSEGSNVKCGSEEKEPKIVKMMSFRKNTIPIYSKISSGENEGYKLSDLLRNNVDSSKHGLAFFVGPVNGKLCYKISVFEKDDMNNMGRPQTNANSIGNSLRV